MPAAACYISPDEMWLFYLLGRTFDQSQTLWLHLATNSKSATRRPFVVQQIDMGNGFTTFIATPVIGVEKGRRFPAQPSDIFWVFSGVETFNCFEVGSWGATQRSLNLGA